jgi:hypothetical protein
MMPVHQSTLALSVYSALTRAGSMTPSQTLAHLRANWAPEMLEAELELGAQYLEARGFVVRDAGVLHARHVRDGAAHPLQRKPGQLTELVLA